MAKTMNIYIHDENAESLKKVDNQSGLINDLLRQHFEKIDIKKMTTDQLKKLIEIEKIKEEYKSKLKA